MKGFKDLNAKQRRNIILGGVIVLFVVAAYELSRPGVLTTKAPPVSATNLLGSADPHQLGQASLNREINQLQSSNGAMAGRVDQMQRELQQQQRDSQNTRLGATPPLNPSFTTTSATGSPGAVPANEAPVPAVPTVNNGTISAPPTGYAGGSAATASPAAYGAQGMPDGTDGVTGGAPAIQTWGDDLGVKKGSAALAANPQGASNGAGTSSASGGDTTPSSASANDAVPGSAAAKAPKIYIPAGTMLTGVLLTGVDAPTGRDAASHPIPVLVRVKEDAILPNEYRADYRECFIVASAMGDLSSERAYLRGETLSCVAQGGGVIQSHLEMWGTGEDGKAGMRGTLVSKQGSILAKAMLAGFASGLGHALTPQIGTTISSSNNGVQTVPLGTAGKMAGYSGISSASDQIASYYLQMADAEFPVIEISAGRPLTFIVEKGAELTKLESGK